MPYCAILQCKNDSRRQNLKNGGVSYHRFPNDPAMKEKWIDATGRVDWMPTKSSTICSEHFMEDDFIISKNGLRYTQPTAIPTSRIVMFFNQQQNPNDANSDFSKRTDLDICHSTPPRKNSRISEGFEFVPTAHSNEQQDEIDVQQPSVGCVIQMEKEINENIGGKSSSSTPRKIKLKGQLRFCKDKIKRQDLKIKRLQSTNRKLRMKISKLEEVLTSLEEKISMSKENLDCL